MRYLRIVLLLSLGVAASFGCDTAAKKKASKEQVTQQWQDARAGVQYAMARQQFDAGALPQARKSVDKALEISPNHLSALILSARVYIEQGQMDGAVATLGHASTLAPANAEVSYLQGVVAQRWQEPQTALTFYHEAAGKAPTELAYVLAEAEMLVTLDRADEALTFLQSKVVYFENSAAIRDAVGQLLMQQNRYAQAMDYLRRAAVLAPEDMPIREHLSLALFYGGEYRDAAASLERLLKQDQYQDRADLYTALGESYMQIGRARDARGSFDRATQLEPASASLWVRLGKAAVQLDDLRRADISLRKALSLEPTLAEAHLLTGYVRLRQQRLAEALEAFNQASMLDRTDTVSLCMIGYVLEKMGRPTQALTYYSQALRLKPQDDLATRLMAQVNTD